MWHHPHDGKLPAKDLGISTEAINKSKTMCLEERVKYYYDVHKDLYKSVRSIEVYNKMSSFQEDSTICSYFVHGNMLAIATFDHTVLFFDIVSEVLVQMINIELLAPSLWFNDKILLCGSYDGDAIKYNRDANKRSTQLYRGHVNKITWLDCVHSFGVVLTASDDGSVKVWELNEPHTLLHTIQLFLTVRTMKSICGILRAAGYIIIILSRCDLHVLEILSEPRDTCSSGTQHIHYKLCLYKSVITTDYESWLCFITAGDLAILTDMTINIYVINKHQKIKHSKSTLTSHDTTCHHQDSVDCNVLRRTRHYNLIQQENVTEV